MALSDSPENSTSGGQGKKPHWTQTPEGRIKWEQTKAAARAKKSQGATSNPSSTSGGGSGASGGGSNSGGGSGRTGHDLMGDRSNKSRKEEDEPVIDVDELKECWPGFLQMLVRGLDSLARAITGIPQAKFELYLNPLGDTDAKFTGKTTWPLVKLMLPEWAKQHPRLLGGLILSVVLLGQIRLRWKKPRPENEEVIDV